MEFVPSRVSPSGKMNIAADVLSRVSEVDYEKSKENGCIKVYRNKVNTDFDKKHARSSFKDLGLKQSNERRHTDRS